MESKADWLHNSKGKPMSAYIVSHDHIRYLVDAAMSRRITQHGNVYWNGSPFYETDYQLAAEIGQALWDENVASVNCRYPSNHEDRRDYGQHRSIAGMEFDPVQIIKACHCYEYQSCEHGGWNGSKAERFIKSLEKAAIRALDGYNDAEWGAPEFPSKRQPRVFTGR